MIFKGWLDGTISNAKSDVDLLKELGVEILGQKSHGAITTYDVKMSEEVLLKLDKHWGRFYWGLQPDNIEKGT